MSWSAAEFEGFRHGYAGTIYKGQGKTLDHTYLYHTASLAVGGELCRADPAARESAQVFVARETARDAGQLARQMARGEVKSASVAWATRDESRHGRGAPGRARDTARQADAGRSASPRRSSAGSEGQGARGPGRAAAPVGHRRGNG